MNYEIHLCFFLPVILKLCVSYFRKKTVVVSLWNDLATTVGQELLDISDKSPVVAIKSLKVGDFQGLTPSFTFQFFNTTMPMKVIG